MEIRITPFSFLASPGSSKTKTNAIFNRNKTPLDKPSYSNHSIRTKKTGSTNAKHFLILPKKNVNKLPVPPGISLSIPQQDSISDKKGILLYQQVERNKLFSNQSELVNRFHFKA